MTADPRSYPEYQDSGVEWLDRIPAHWDCLPNRALFEEIKDQGHVDEPLLSVTISKGLIRQSDLLAGSSKKDSSNLDKSKYKLVVPGDIAYNKMRAWQGAVGVSRHRGIVSPAYIVVRLRNSNNPEYFHFLFRTPGFATEAERWSYGITSDQWSLRHEHFKMIYSCVPLRPEQDAIVAFLRHADARVRRFIRNRRRLIAVLNEQKQAIVNRAVTRGLDPNVPLKPSGIDWLGDIPKHWRAVRLKYVSRVQTGITLGKNYMGLQVEERPYLRVANVQTGRLDLRRVKTVAVPASEIAGSELKPGDVLMTEGGDIDKLGRGCVWQGEIEGCLHQNHIFAVRADQSRLLPDYLMALMASRHGRVYFQLTAKQTTNLASTNSSTLGAFPLVLPEVKEQRHILDGLGKETLSLDAAIGHAQGEIDLIREYRTRLIADVVTGKVDVRRLAPPPEAMVAETEPEGLDEGLEDEMIGEDEAELAQEVTDADD
jgi:type I restriction enzyme, S subunit